MVLRKKYKRILIVSLILGTSLTIINLIPKDKIEEVHLEEINEEIINEKLETKEYFAILEIPSINLKRELFPTDSEENDVDKNLYLLNSSTFPSSEEKSNLIIAGHSGNANNAYFKNLYKLTLNNEFYLYYNGEKYTYLIKEIEYQDKTGTLYLKNDYSNMITLITCSKNDNKTQTIYYAELENV